MISANNNISQSSDRFSTLTDSSQTKSGDKNSFAVKMDKILKKYKKTNDDIIRNQREAQLRLEKTAIEEETSEAARIAMAFISRDTSGTDLASADSAGDSGTLSYEDITKSLISDISQLSNADSSDEASEGVDALSSTSSADDLAEQTMNASDMIAAIPVSGSASQSITDATVGQAATQTSQSDLLENFVRFFEQNGESASESKTENLDSQSGATQSAGETVAEKQQSTGGIKLKDLERILSDSGFGKFSLSAEKTEKTTADVGLGRQLPNVTFKAFGEKSTSSAEEVATKVESATTAEAIESVSETAGAKPIVPESAASATSNKSNTDSNEKESLAAEGANISTSKANNQKSENNNLQFSAGNHESGSQNSEAKQNLKKLSTSDAVASQQVLQQKTESIAENVQKTQELKDVDIKEFATRISDAVRNTESNSANRLSMTLTPDSLGTLIVEVAVEGDAARISIKAETQDAAKAIEEQMPLLKEKLEAQGLKLEQAEVSHYSRNDSAGQSFSRDKERREEYQLRREFIRTSGRNDEDLQEDKD